MAANYLKCKFFPSLQWSWASNFNPKVTERCSLTKNAVPEERAELMPVTIRHVDEFYRSIWAMLFPCPSVRFIS